MPDAAIVAQPKLSREVSCRSQHRTSAPHSGNCTKPAASCCPTLGMSAAHGRCSIWDSRRSPPPAQASRGRSERRTTASPSRTCWRISPRCAARSICPSTPISRAALRKNVAANVARAVKTGVAGLSIEDSTGDAAKPLYERAFAIERIKAARSAIEADNSGVLLTGRCEGFLVGEADLAMVIDRLNAYAGAGADCLYAPGIKM